MNMYHMESVSIFFGNSMVREAELDCEKLSVEEHWRLYEYIDRAKENAFFSWYLFGDVQHCYPWFSIAAYLRFLQIKDRQTEEMLEVLGLALLGHNEQLINLVLNHDYRFLDETFMVNLYDKGESFRLHRFALLGQWQPLADYIQTLTESYEAGRYKSFMTDNVNPTPFAIEMELTFYTALLNQDHPAMQAVMDELSQALYVAQQEKDAVYNTDNLFSVTAFLLLFVARKNGITLQVTDEVVPEAWLDVNTYHTQPTPWRMVLDLQESHRLFHYEPNFLDFPTQQSAKIIEMSRSMMCQIELLNLGFKANRYTFLNAIRRSDVSPSNTSRNAAAVYAIDKKSDVLKYVASKAKNHWPNKKVAEAIFIKLKYGEDICGQIWMPMLVRDSNTIHSLTQFPQFDEATLGRRALPYYREFLEERTNIGSKPHRFWLFQLVLAENFERLRIEAHKVLQANVNQNAQTEAQFFISLLEGDKAAMEISLHQMLAEYAGGLRKTKDFNISSFIAVDALVCLLIAQRHGFELDIDSPYVPQSLLVPEQEGDISEYVSYERILSHVTRNINELKATFGLTQE